uniref:Colipase C-terminal domain-containing protein n=1 Tax=Coturnix japonica TaxID=93934 RepID=A0A8C2SRB5_COTJA
MMLPLRLLLVALLVTLALGAPNERGLIFNLVMGEHTSPPCDICFGVSGPKGRCLTEPLSPQSLYGVYYKCPCESGLSCDADWSIVGSITNTDYGICYDKRDSASR